MDYHIDRKIILNPDSEFQSLYDWSLQEFDAGGEKVGRDQIPWKWSLYFTASELVIGDTLTIEPCSRYTSEEKNMIVREQQIIWATLRPGHPKDRDPYSETSYSMFGTNRTISSFGLCIRKLEQAAERERCTAWGSISYTAEVDFRSETTEDCVTFDLYVRPEKFAWYAEKIAISAVDEVVLRVSGVKGFYSDWSPSISTNEIKVMTSENAHKVEIPSDCLINPPQLGEVTEAEFYFRRHTKLAATVLKTFEEAERSGHDDKLSKDVSDSAVDVQPIQNLATSVASAVNLLSSVRTAAWIIAGLLLLIFLAK